MPETILVIGDRRSSAASLSPWLLLRHNGLAFQEVSANPDRPNPQLARHGSMSRVPCLIHEDVKVWDAMAICEQAAEMFRLRDAWPGDARQRGLARSICAEVHCGLTALREQLPFDATRSPQSVAVSDAAMSDFARIRQLWRDVRAARPAPRSRRGGAEEEGAWLFGRFSIADAMFAPVVVRLHAYNLPLDHQERGYVHALLSMQGMREWLGAAMLESALARPPADEDDLAARRAAPRQPVRA